MADIVVLCPRPHRAHRHVVKHPPAQRGDGSVGGERCHGAGLLLKELHRRPKLPQSQTSAYTRYLNASTTAAQRLRALGQNCVGLTSAVYDLCRRPEK